MNLNILIFQIYLLQLSSLENIVLRSGQRETWSRKENLAFSSYIDSLRHRKPSASERARRRIPFARDE